MSVLEFAGARMLVQLGCSAEERSARQEVDLGVSIRFTEPPPGCETDELEDTISYSELIDSARALCAERQFKLVERLAAELFAHLRRELPPGAELWLRVTKLRPPVDDLHGGVSFSLGDWEPGRP